MRRPVWHVFPICFRLSIWGGVLSVPTANCKLYLFNQIGEFKGEQKEGVPRHLGFHDLWCLSFWGMLETFWLLSSGRILLHFIGKVVFLKFQRGWRNSLGQNFQIACGKIRRRGWTVQCFWACTRLCVLERPVDVPQGRRGALIRLTEVFKEHCLLCGKTSTPHLESLAKTFEWAPKHRSTRMKCSSCSITVPVFRCMHHFRNLSLNTRGWARLVETGRWVWKRHLLHTFD